MRVIRDPESREYVEYVEAKMGTCKGKQHTAVVLDILGTWIPSLNTFSLGALESCRCSATMFKM